MRLQSLRLEQAIAGLMLTILSSTVFAGDARHYIGISDENYALTELSGLSYKYGYDFGNTWSVEVQYGQADLDTTSTLITKFSSFTNILARANLRYEKVNVYALLGYGVADMTLNFAGSDSSYSGASYGVGLDMWGSKNTAVSVTWMRHVAVDSSLNVVAAQVDAIDSVSLGLTHHFDFGQTVKRY